VESTAGGSDEIERRKGDHLAVTTREDVSARTGAGWGDIRLVHEAVPETDLDAVDLGTRFLGRELAAPLFIASMTGGHPEAAEVNAVLARAAERYGLAMGVGSQRAAIRRPELAPTYTIARRSAPTAFLVGNVGAAQLVAQADEPRLTADEVRDALTAIRADALAVHLNFLQETVQPEGERRAAGIVDAIADLVRQLDVPVIAKETGAGLSRRSARVLASAGVAALDVGGLGGTTFAAVEAIRAARRNDARGQRLGEVFREWGMPTAVALAAAAPTGLPLIATGGLRTGLDAAKAITLGATLVGVARPLLQACASGGDEAVGRWIEQFLAELRAAVFLSGCVAVHELRHRPRVILGETREWLVQLGYWGGAMPASLVAPATPEGRETPATQ
jgi:isopentenyl-diphosphate delta-isomerase